MSVIDVSRFSGLHDVGCLKYANKLFERFVLFSDGSNACDDSE